MIVFLYLYQYYSIVHNLLEYTVTRVWGISRCTCIKNKSGVTLRMWQSLPLFNTNTYCRNIKYVYMPSENILKQKVWINIINMKLNYIIFIEIIVYLSATDARKYNNIFTLPELALCRQWLYGYIYCLNYDWIWMIIYLYCKTLITL